MPNGGTTIYPGVRHPNFPASTENDDEDDEYEYDGGCPDCNGGIDDRCVCDDDGGGCPECGAGGSGDPYGECVCYPE